MIIGKTRTNQPVEGGQEFEDALLNSDTSFENIVDEDGHKRFIEGDITINTTEGFTQKYGKWSLSGSHLLMVVAIEISASTSIANGSYLADINLPEWIMNKIYPIIEPYLVDEKTFLSFNSSWATSNHLLILEKRDGKLKLRFGGAYSITDLRSLRVAFDLLIDND